MIALTAKNVSSFSGKTITVTYDASMLQLADAAAQAYGVHTATGAIPDTGMMVTFISPGNIQFTFDKDIPQGMKWSGVITVLKLKGLATGTATVYME